MTRIFDEWRCCCMWAVGFGLLLLAVDTDGFGYGIPTEVVEEWGCHDTEIRLTCGRLDATIAILEATYTPNCTGQTDDDDCIHMDFKKLTRSYTASPRMDAHLTETEAGRQFLETLQRNRANDEHSTIQPSAQISDGLISVKTKRNSLRISLEQLIVEYLNELSPAETEDNAKSRQRRRRDARQSDDTEDEDPVTRVDVDELRRVEIASRNIIVERFRKDQIGKTSECAAYRKQITQLDQYELDKTLTQSDESQLNIRKVLNYKCSGKNHCSFVFSTDYPYSIMWHDGTVRIKYICMDNFRLNKYCNERLRINHEPHQDMVTSPPMVRTKKGDPVAEARIQNDLSFTQLKIIKLSDTENAQPELGAKPKSKAGEPKRRKNSDIFSQDFRIVQIIPKHANTVNQTSNYVPKQANERTKSPSTATTPNPIMRSPPDIVTDSGISTTTTTTTPKNEPNNLDVNVNNVIEQTTQILVRTTKEPEVLQTTTSAPTTSPNVVEDVEQISNDLTTSDGKHLDKMIEEPDYDNEMVDEMITSTSTTTTSTVSPLKVTTPAAGSISEYYDELEESYEDYSVDWQGRQMVRKNKNRIHISEQMSLYKGSPLRQGFLASPGYPMYYIGESNCSWTITAPTGHRVRLTVLDIHLREEDSCRDTLEIVDQYSVVYSNCTELAKPLQIVSNSNELQIHLKTKSRLAYPMRGVLMHYTALGCLTLPGPANGRLVHTGQDTAKYVCEPAFHFPDTAVSSRELRCTEHYTWDKTLPDCVEISQLRPIELSIRNQTAGRHTNQYPLRLNHTHSLAPTIKMSDTGMDQMYVDVVIPSVIIAGLFILNAAVFMVIIRYRNKRKEALDLEEQEMARL